MRSCPVWRLSSLLLLILAWLVALSGQTAGEGRSAAQQLVEPAPWFPNILGPYQAYPAPPLVLENSPRLESLTREGKLELTVADALALALENNLDLAVQRYVPVIAETDVLRTSSGQAARGVQGALVPSGLTSGALGVGVSASGGGGGLGSAGGITGGGGAISIGSSGNFDPSLNMNFSWDRVTSPLNTIQVAGIPIVTANATAFSSNYAQMFRTGTSYSVSITGQRQGSTQQRLRFNPAVVSRVSLAFHQPLLNGFGREANERFIRVALNNTATSQEVFRQQVITTVVQVENAYWDLAALQQNVRVAEQSLAVAERLLSDNRLRVEIGSMPPLEVTSADAEVAARTRDLTLARTNLQLQEANLKNLLVKRNSPELDNVAVVLKDQMPAPATKDLPDVKTALETAFKNRPDLRQAQSNLENQELATRFTEKSLKPSAAIFGLYAGSGLDGNEAQIPGGASGSFQQAFYGDFPEYGGGVSLSIPIRNRVAQADNLRSQLEEKQLRLGVQRSHNQVALEVRKAMIGLIQGRAQLEAAREAARLAREIWVGEQERLEAGVSTSYQVILRERDLVAAQQAEVNASVGYAKAIVEMGRAMGTALERRGIELADALTGTASSSQVTP
ncbi:MAG: TolC family protein [Acidobacteria bacterium]|nr:MAG: TolC family protein [Acidobacteriota bacterium]